MTFQQRYKNLLTMAEYGNDKGYEGVWVTEHHFSDYGWCPNPLMLLAKIGEVAPNVRLGTAVLVLPVWHPLRLAEDVATLDVLSDGRVDVGIGRGFQLYEFNRLGAELAKNRDIFNESLDIVLKAWTEDDFEYEGQFWKIPRTTVFPKPLQKPHPPIWMAATTRPSIRSAVERGYHLATGSGTLFEELQMRNAYIDSVLNEMGRSLDGVQRAAIRFVFCSTSRSAIDDAIDQSRWQVRAQRSFAQENSVVGGRTHPQPYPEEPDRETWQRRMIIGDPAECVRRIEALARAGISYIYGLFEFGALTGEKAMASARLFTEEVMPAINAVAPYRPDQEEREAIADAFSKAGPGYQGV